jgi:type I restriction enzyme S subunit
MSERPLSTIAEINPSVHIPHGISPSDLVSFIPMSDVSESGQWTVRQLRPMRSIQAGFTSFQDGDVLVAKITPCLENGKGTHAVGLHNGIGFGSTEFHTLRTKPGNDPRFIFNLTQWGKFRRAAESQMVGSAGQQRVPRQFFDEFLVAEFDQAEQALIAQILDTLDTAIQETEALIAKLKAVKQGLLHDLLTRGIDANGELRPPQAEAPQLYKESALGWIPKEWTPVQIGKLATLQRGHDIVEACFVYGTYPVISSSGVIGYHNVATSRGPNVVVGRKGSIGTVHYVEGDFWAHDTSLFVTNFFGNDVRFVFHLFDYMDLGRFGTKSGSPSLNRNDVHPLIVGRPSHAEQERIVLAIASHESTSQKTILELAKLRILKSGLMDDLLTGRVRVTPLLEGHAT